jgi:capsular polysaccharide export protein
MTPSRGAASARCYVARSPGLLLVRGLQRFLDLPIRFRPFGRPPPDAAAVIGWGLKGVSLKARDAAHRYQLPYLALEDGFLRSVVPGSVEGPLSLAVDDLGVYYDAHAPSRLEAQIAREHTSAECERGAALAALWRRERVSKYNHARERPPPTDMPFVLVVDQTAGDASIHYGMAGAPSFLRMLEAALDEHPGLPIVLKVHPDVIEGRKRAHFGNLTPGQAKRVTLLAENAHPPGLIERAAAVYVVTSQMGFEALLWDRPVRCFGMPFYAGWGLTQDDLASPARRAVGRCVTRDELVHAALVEYTRWVDPESGERCDPERVIAWMGLQRRQRERFPPRIQAVGWSNWKQPIARRFLAGSELRFVTEPQAPPAGEARAVWGRPAAAVDVDAASAAPLLRVEDGFLRSVGLGANWVTPLSWVIDRGGMYYDATSPSDLEDLLQHTDFDAATLARARALREAIVRAGITKYNVGSGGWQRPDGTARVVLVPGQVEDDASITWGAPGLRTNAALLAAVRKACPDAHIVYKPHPDVLARKRPGDASIDAAALSCDEIVTDVPIHRLFQQVEEVHVLTSLAGFEALLRGKPVTCHGSPFFAGWGLTRDTQNHPRRTRRLELDALVAGALIAYPTYVSRTTGQFTTPERALHELAHWEQCAPPVEAAAIRTLRALKRTRDAWRGPR